MGASTTSLSTTPANPLPNCLSPSTVHTGAVSWSIVSAQTKTCHATCTSSASPVGSESASHCKPRDSSSTTTTTSTDDQWRTGATSQKRTTSDFDIQSCQVTTTMSIEDIPHLADCVAGGTKTSETGGRRETGGRYSGDRSAWRPKLTQHLHTQTTFASAQGGAARAEGGEGRVVTSNGLMWHIQLPPLFLIHSLWPSDAGELISSSRLLPWDQFLATKSIRHGGVGGMYVPEDRNIHA